MRHAALSWFGCGLSPVAPGTVGSLGALPLGALIHLGFGAEMLAMSSFALFFIGWGISVSHFRGVEPEDPQWVVIDEVAGQWVALSVVPFTVVGFLVAFLLFRLFDILKPWPVSWADRKVGGGLGIMLDDFLAGLYAAIVGSLVLWGLETFWPAFV